MSNFDDLANQGQNNTQLQGDGTDLRQSDEELAKQLQMQELRASQMQTMTFTAPTAAPTTTSSYETTYYTPVLGSIALPFTDSGYEPAQVEPEDDYNKFILIKKQAATVKLISAFHMVRSVVKYCKNPPIIIRILITIILRYILYIYVYITTYDNFEALEIFISNFRDQF